MVEVPATCSEDQLKRLSGETLSELALERECNTKGEIIRTKYEDVKDSIQVIGPAPEEKKADIVLLWNEKGELVDAESKEVVEIEPVTQAD